MYQPEEILKANRHTQKPTRGPPILSNGAVYEAQSIIGFDGVHYYAQPYLGQDDRVYYIQPVVDAKGIVYEADGFLAPNGLTYYAMPVVENGKVYYIRPIINPEDKVIYPDKSHPAYSSYAGDDLHALPDDHLYNDNDVVEVEIQDTNTLDENGKPKLNIIVRNRKSIAFPDNATIIPEGGMRWTEGDQEIIETVYLDHNDLHEDGQPKEKKMRVRRQINLPQHPSITSTSWNAKQRVKRQVGPLPGEQLEKEESLRSIPLTAEERSRLEEFQQNMSVQCELQYIEGSLDLGEVIRKSFRIYSHGGSIDIDVHPEPVSTFQPETGRGWVPVSTSVPPTSYYEEEPVNDFERTEFVRSLEEQGIEVPKDENGEPIMTAEYIKSLPKEARMKPEAKKKAQAKASRSRERGYGPGGYGQGHGPGQGRGYGPGPGQEGYKPGQEEYGPGQESSGLGRGRGYGPGREGFAPDQEGLTPGLAIGQVGKARYGWQRGGPGQQGPYDPKSQVLDEYGFPLQGSEIAGQGSRPPRPAVVTQRLYQKVDANGKPVVDSRGHPIRVDVFGNAIVDAYGNSVIDSDGNVVVDADGKPLVAVDANGKPLEPVETDTAGNPIIPIDSNGKPIIPVDANGKPMIAVDAQGNPVKPIIPVDANGKPTVAVDAQGNPIVVELKSLILSEAKSSGLVHGFKGQGYKQGRIVTQSTHDMLQSQRHGGLIPSRRIPMKGQAVTSKGQLAIDNPLRGVTLGPDGIMQLNGVPVSQIHGDNGAIIRQKLDQEGAPTDEFVDEQGKVLKLVHIKGEDETVISTFVDSAGTVISEVPAISSKAGPLAHGVPTSDKLGQPFTYGYPQGYSQPAYPGPIVPPKPAVVTQKLYQKVDANGKPVVDSRGNPIRVDAMGNAIVDAHGNSVIDSYGNVVVDAQGKPLVAVDAKGKPLEAVETIPLDSKGKPIIPVDANGKPMVAVDTQGNPIVVEFQAPPLPEIQEFVTPNGLKVQQITGEDGKVSHVFMDNEGQQITQYIEDGKAIQQITTADGLVVKQFVGQTGQVVQQFTTKTGKLIQQFENANGVTIFELVNDAGETVEIDPTEYGIVALKPKNNLFANPLEDHGWKPTWTEGGVPVAVGKDGHIVPANWMLSGGKFVAVVDDTHTRQPGFRIKGSKQRTQKKPKKGAQGKGKADNKTDSDSDSFDFAFQGDGKILDSDGHPVSIKWQVMDASGHKIALDPNDFSFEADGTVYDNAGKLQEFSWKLIDDGGGFVPLEAEFIEEPPPPPRTGIRFEGGYVLAGPDGNLIKPITSGLHIVHSRGAFHLDTTANEDLLSPVASASKPGAEIIGPSGSPLMRITESGRVTGPNGTPLATANILDPRGNQIHSKGQVMGPDGLPIFLIQTGHRKGSHMVDQDGEKLVQLETGMALLDKNGNMLMMFDTGGQVTSSKGNFRMAGQIGSPQTLEVYDYFIMDIGGGDIQENRIQKRLQKMINKYVAPPEEEKDTKFKFVDKRVKTKRKSHGPRTGPGFFNFPECLKGKEWTQFLKPCDKPGTAGKKHKHISRKAAPEVQQTVQDLILEEEEDDEEEEEIMLTPEEEEAEWEKLRISGYLEHIDENDPELIAKNKSIASLNKFKLHPIRKQHWDIRRSLDGTRPLTRQEVAFHCDNGDILLIRNKKVINAMSIVVNHVAKFQDKILPLINMKGQDISHWFNRLTGEPRTKIDLRTGKKVLYTPNGIYYGLGPIRRQLELEQESEHASAAHSSVHLNEPGVPLESEASKDYQTYVTENYEEKAVSDFDAPLRHSIFSEIDYSKEMEGEDQEMSMQTPADWRGESEGEAGDEYDRDDEHPGEMDDPNYFKRKSVKSVASDASSSNETPPVFPSSPKQMKSPPRSNESSPENLSPEGSEQLLDRSRSKSRARAESTSSHPRSPKKSISNLSAAKSKKSFEKFSDESPVDESVASATPRKSIKEGDESDHQSKRKSLKSDHKIKFGSNDSNLSPEQEHEQEHEKNKSFEEHSGGSNTSPTLSPENSKRIIRGKSRILDMVVQEEDENVINSEEGILDEDGFDIEDVLSHNGSHESVAPSLAITESSMNIAMSTIPQMGSEHSIISEVPSVFSKTTIDTTAQASTLYGAQVNSMYQDLAWSELDPNYEEVWWLDPKYICGHVPKSTLGIRIINALSYDERVLTISREYTINDIMRYYIPYNQNAMGYRWEDMFGNVLHPDRTVVENGLVDLSLSEDNGFNCYPVIILVYIDGFEDEPIVSLNPKELAKQMLVAQICRNY